MGGSGPQGAGRRAELREPSLGHSCAGWAGQEGTPLSWRCLCPRGREPGWARPRQVAGGGPTLALRGSPPGSPGNLSEEQTPNASRRSPASPIVPVTRPNRDPAWLRSACWPSLRPHLGPLVPLLLDEPWRPSHEARADRIHLPGAPRAPVPSCAPADTCPSDPGRMGPWPGPNRGPAQRVRCTREPRATSQSLRQVLFSCSDNRGQSGYSGSLSPEGHEDVSPAARWIVGS